MIYYKVTKTHTIYILFKCFFLGKVNKKLSIVEEKNKNGGNQMAVVSMKQLLESGVHFGHATRRWDPKMAPYIFTSRNGIHIIDLKKTAEEIERAYQALFQIIAEGGKVLFIGTKKQEEEAVKEEAIRTGQFYVDKRWLGNFNKF